MPGCPVISMPSDRPESWLRRAPRWMIGRLGTLCLVLAILSVFVGAASYAPPAYAGFALEIRDDFNCTSQPDIVRTIPTPSTDSQVFTFILNVYQASLFTVMAKGYCAMREVAAGPISAGLLLAVVVFGIAVLIGATRLTIREGMMLLVKMSLVLMFALNAQLTMSIAFKFFYNMSDSMMGWVDPNALTFLNGSTTTSTATPSPFPSVIPVGDPDSSFGRFAGYFNETKMVGGKAVSAHPCAGPLFLFLTVFAAIFPVIGAPLVVMLLTFVMIFIRSLLGFLVAMGALCMLMTTAPVFIGFALFRVTYGFFDRWLKSMISYSLQMVLVFFIVWTALGMFDFFNMFTNLEKALAPPPDATYSLLFGNTETPTICTPCVGFEYANPSTAGVSPTVGFDQFKCANTPKGQNAAVGVPITANLTETVPTFGAYLVTNIIYLLVLLWAIKEMIVAAPQIAFQLAGDTSSMSVGGRVGRSETPKGSQERYSFEFGEESNSLDRRMDKMTEYIRFAVDSGYKLDIKEKIRDTNPEFLQGNALSRLSQGIQLGWVLQDSNLSEAQIYEHLPQHMQKESKRATSEQERIKIQGQLEAKRASLRRVQQLRENGEISEDQLAAFVKDYQTEEAALEEQLEKEDQARQDLRDSFDVMDIR